MKFLALLLALLCQGVFASEDIPILLPKNEIIPEFIQKALEAKRIVNGPKPYEYNQALPDVVDLRWRDTEVQRQPGPTCTAFGLSAAMENLLGGQVKLSENHLWSLYQEYQAAPAVAAASKNAITLEEYWPIAQNKASVDYLKYARYYIKSAHYIEDKIDLAVKSLAEGKPVYLGFVVTSDVANCKVRPDPKSSAWNAGHAVAVVGYDQTSRTFLIKNSWGKKCAEAGYQYIPFEYCARNGMFCLMWTIDEIGEKEVSPLLVLNPLFQQG